MCSLCNNSVLCHICLVLSRAGAPIFLCDTLQNTAGGRWKLQLKECCEYQHLCWNSFQTLLPSLSHSLLTTLSLKKTWYLYCTARASGKSRTASKIDVYSQAVYHYLSIQFGKKALSRCLSLIESSACRINGDRHKVLIAQPLSYFSATRLKIPIGATSKSLQCPLKCIDMRRHCSSVGACGIVSHNHDPVFATIMADGRQFMNGRMRRVFRSIKYMMLNTLH